MGDVVRDTWLDFTDPLEGGAAAPVIYQDIRGKVTGPYGLLCDSAAEVAALPMDHPDGRPATAAEKVAAFTIVKNDPLAAQQGWRRAATLTPLRLSVANMHALALRKFDAHDAAGRQRFPDWAEYPACARMALHSLWWACGSSVHFPRLYFVVNGHDWDAASVEIHMDEWTPEGLHNTGLIPRNVANKILMRNAQRVDTYKLDPDTLNWASLIGVDDVDTLPQLPDTEETEHAASSPTTGPGPIIHPLRYDRGPDDSPDDPSAA